ncbi:MAG: hypothetical protein DI529_16135 [Chryseobacterium sp.]|nr:MAG: hypothetical protein DI529_16135 [Chryseobacterium sp.]
MKKILTFLFLPFLLFGQDYSWQQYGNTIPDPINEAGTNVSLSSDGQRLVKADSRYNSNRGAVSIYQYNNGSWEIFGNRILGGEEYISTFGRLATISPDGNTVALSINDDNGRVKVFRYDGNFWVQIGSDLVGKAYQDWFGQRHTSTQAGLPISLSKDGNTIIIGAYGNDDGGSNAGQVRVFKYINNDWVQLGSDINGDLASANLGVSVDINDAGDIIAIGIPGRSNNTGRVQVYKYNGTSWELMGNNFDGNSLDYLGMALSLNDSGDTIALAYRRTSKKYYQVYKYSNNQWSQLGGNIAETGDSNSYWQMQLDGDGDRIAVSSGSTVTTADKSLIKTYDFDGTVWSLKTANLFSSSDSSYFLGKSFKLSSEGNYLGVLCSNNDADAYAKVFKITSNATMSVSDSDLSELTLYPNPAKNLIRIDSLQNIKDIQIFDISGKKLLSAKTDLVDISSLRSGNYIVNISLKNGEKISKKIIKE